MRSQTTIPDGYALLDRPRGYIGHIGPLYRRLGGERPTMGFRVGTHHVNGMNNAHGGMLMTFADVAWGHVVAVETSSYWVTVRLTCDFLSSARLGDWIEAGAETLSREGGVYVMRGRVWRGEDTLMEGTGLFKAIKPREPRPGEAAYTG